MLWRLLCQSWWIWLDSSNYNSNISKIEKREVDLRISTIQELAKGLEVHSQELFNLTVNRITEKVFAAKNYKKFNSKLHPAFCKYNVMRRFYFMFGILSKNFSVISFIIPVVSFSSSLTSLFLNGS